MNLRDTDSAAFPASKDESRAIEKTLIDLRQALVSEIALLRDKVDKFQYILRRQEAKISEQHESIVSLTLQIKQRDDESFKQKETRDDLISQLESARGALANRNRYISSLLSSTSWKITGPIRFASRCLRYIQRGILAWSTFKPGSRPHRIARRLGITKIAPTSETQLSWDRPICGERSDRRIVYLFVDHTVGCEVNTGIQRTVRGLATGLIKLGEAVRFVKWDSALQKCVLIDATERDHLARWNGPAIGDRDKQIYLPSTDRRVLDTPQRGDWLIVPEATCITNQSAPVTLNLMRWGRENALKLGFVFYDAIPLRRPELMGSVPEQKSYMRALRFADSIWSISSWSAADLTSFWATEDDGSAKPPIYLLGLPGEFASSRDCVIPSAHLILSVGTIEPRKNQVALIRAFQAYRAAHPDSDWSLQLVGNLHGLVAEEVMAATRADSAIQYRGHISDDELTSLYQRCAFTVFPSVEEGFGLPILESLWYGKPCVCADFGSMAEVAVGGGCLTVNTMDPAALRLALEDLILDPALRSRLAAEAQARAMMSWADYAQSIIHTTWQGGQVYYLAQATAEWDRNTGIQRVVRQLGRALLDLGVDLIPVKLSADGLSLEPMTGDEKDRLAAFNGPQAEKWLQWISPSKASANSWFFMAELPLHLSPPIHGSLLQNLKRVGIKSAAVFYDAIPWKMSDVYPSHYGQAHASYMTLLSSYDVVGAISEFSRDDLAQFWEDPVRKLEGHVEAIVLPGEFSESQRSTSVWRPLEEGEISILAVGTVEPRKNYETLLRAFSKASAESAKPLHLTIVGSSVSIEPALADRVRALVNEHESITWDEHADDGMVKQLFESCDFTVYPSVEEGFGLPILESLWYGKPVICANFGAMKEVTVGGGCLAVDVRDENALALAIGKLALDLDQIEALSREAVARRFRTWKDYAREFASKTVFSSALLPILNNPRSDLSSDPDRDRLGELCPTDQPLPEIYYLVESTATHNGNTGIQRVVRQLARLLMQRGFKLIPARWDTSRKSLTHVSEQGLRNVANFNGPKVHDWFPWRELRASSGGWFLLGEVQQHWQAGDHLDLVAALKSCNIRTAAIFYDAIPVKMAEIYPNWLVEAHYRYMIELGFYDRVFAISEFSGDDLKKFLLSKQFLQSNIDDLVRIAALPGEFPNVSRVTSLPVNVNTRPFHLLAVGTVEPRKNHETLARAFLLAQTKCSEPIQLTIVGSTNAVDPSLRDRLRGLIGGNPSIIWKEIVDDAELDQCYAACDLTVYPSTEEGFGLPILESLWHGKPCICADFGAMSEAAEAGGCLTVDVRNVVALSDAICSVAQDPSIMNALLREVSLAQIKSWQDYADEIADNLLEHLPIDADHARAES